MRASTMDDIVEAFEISIKKEKTFVKEARFSLGDKWQYLTILATYTPRNVLINKYPNLFCLIFFS